MQHLMQSGMADATDVILTGCSGSWIITRTSFSNVSMKYIIAGGLATYLHADMLSDILPREVRFKAMADAG